MNDLIAFLRARLDEDEQIARQACEYTEAVWRLDEDGETVLWEPPNPRIAKWEREHGLTVLADVWRGQAIYSDGIAKAPHIARHDPARVLAEVEAKRRIVDLMAGLLDSAEGDSEVDHYGGVGAAEDALRLLALPYADRHPDYREEWSP